MTNQLGTECENEYLTSGGLQWSGAERAVARKAFDAALKRELDELMRDAKHMAGQMRQPSDLWELEEYFTERRKEIDRKYDYRYSVLTEVFGRLLYEKRVLEEDLRGLREDKLESIRSFAHFLAKDVA